MLTYQTINATTNNNQQIQIHTSAHEKTLKKRLKERHINEGNQQTLLKTRKHTRAQTFEDSYFILSKITFMVTIIIS